MVFEYKTIHTHLSRQDFIDKRLNGLSKNGWKLIAVVFANNNFWHTLERAKKND